MERLQERLARGESAAFAELYDACADRLYSLLLARLGSREDAADVMQETFLRLTKNRNKLTEVNDLMAYVFVVARNEAVRFASRKRLPQKSVALHELSGAALDDDVADRDESAFLSTAVSGLEKSQRDVVELRLYGNLSFAQIASVLDLPQGTVATRFRAAVERLRQAMSKGTL